MKAHFSLFPNFLSYFLTFRTITIVVYKGTQIMGTFSFLQNLNKLVLTSTSYADLVSIAPSTHDNLCVTTNYTINLSGNYFIKATNNLV